MLLDCEQSLFFFRQCTRARAFSGEAARHEKRGRRLQSRAWSFACLGRFARLTKKKERLLVVQNAPVYAQFPTLALASPFACCSRVTSRDFPKWRALAQATTPQYFYNKCIGAALTFKGLSNGGISPGRRSLIGLKSAFIFSLNVICSLDAPVYAQFLTCAKRLTQMDGIMIEHLLRCTYRE